MPLAVFDLDHTLLNGDSNKSWNDFIAQENLVDRESHIKTNAEFSNDYHAGRLDIEAYIEFTMKILPCFDMDFLKNLRTRFIDIVVKPMITKKSLDLLARHRSKGDFLLLMTATNRFVAEPIADCLKMDELLCSEPLLIDGRYTGKMDGTACFKEGKVIHLERWLKKNKDLNLKDSWFYSDSHNDLPLLEKVDNPVAVNPDPVLLKAAEKRGWLIMDLRD
ncbi:HAD hydrolase, family IB [Desulfonema limicola]|uniref:HAD hydrolase, family IB n=1 Tax=Desulfonema limicola TaxID=45656 RepID=A0A975BDJ8_9BACT|nr:HAD family hydrolase [Desulfonema limicola]QTA83348.1 HAD hydrolase, family IB [Desulfonema limicola]